MQVLPGAPGTARQGRTRSIIVSTYDGGNATQPRAPGHDRPFTASSGAAKHGRLSAATRAPGADVPPATAAGAPGQYCLSAALQAPGDDAPLATTAGAPDHHRLSAAPIATVPLPAGPRRLRQGVLPRVPANPRTLTYSPAHRLTRHSRLPPRHSRESGNPRPPVATGGPQGGYAPATPSPGACSGGGLGRGRLPAHHITHQVHPAIQVPPRPRSCSTADTGLSRHRCRAPPPASHREPTRANPFPPLHMVERAGVRPAPSPCIAGGP